MDNKSRHATNHLRGIHTTTSNKTIYSLVTKTYSCNVYVGKGIAAKGQKKRVLENIAYHVAYWLSSQVADQLKTVP